MKILSLNGNNNNYTFKSKSSKLDSVINSDRLKKQLDKIGKADDGTRKLFSGLSALAAAAIAEFTILAEQEPDVRSFANAVMDEFDKEELQNLKDKFVKFIFTENEEKTETTEVTDNEADEKIDYSVLFEEKPERNTYLAVTSKYFPDLNEKYENMLIKSLKEPENDENLFVLDTLENIFNILTADGGLKYRKRYFEALNDDYKDCLEDVCKNFISTICNGGTPMQYLVLLSNGAITPEEIKKWAKADSLSLEQFMKISMLNENIISNIAELEKQYKDFQIKDFRKLESGIYRAKDYAFKLEYNEGVSLTDKLVRIKQVHEAIYGPIYLKANKIVHENFMYTDIQAEMVDNILKDRRMDAVYNFVRYINPSALKGLNVKPEEVKFLQKDDEKYQQLKKICTDEVMQMNFESEQVQSLCDVLNDDAIFEDIITTRHGKLRFLTRVVMKEKVKKNNLSEKTAHKMNVLREEIGSKIELCNIFCYFHTLGQAPQFYLRDSQLGNYLKVTLNSEGSIHTIYEDVKKEIRDRELAAESKVD